MAERGYGIQRTKRMLNREKMETKCLFINNKNDKRIIFQLFLRRIEYTAAAAV